MADTYGGGVGPGAGLIEGGGTGSHKRKRRPTPAPPQQPREPQQVPGPAGGSQPTAPVYRPPAPVYNPPVFRPPPPPPDPLRQYTQANRISQFDSNLIREQPFLVGSLVSSSATDLQIQRIAEGLASAYLWLSQQPIIGSPTQDVAQLANQDVPGLTPAQRQSGLMQAVPVAAQEQQFQQQLLGRYGRANEYGDLLPGQQQAAATPTNALGVTPGTTATGTEYLGAGQTAGALGIVGSLPGVGGLQGYVEHQYGAAVPLQVPSGPSVIGKGVTAALDLVLPRQAQSILDDLNSRIYDLVTAAEGGDPAMNRAYNPAIARDPGVAAAGALFNPVAKLASLPFQGAGALLGATGRVLNAPQFEVAGVNIHPFGLVKQAGDIVAAAGRKIGALSNEAGAVIASASGAKPGTPLYDLIQSMGAFYVQIEIGKVMATAARAGKLAVTEPSDLLAPAADKGLLKESGTQAGMIKLRTPAGNVRAELSPTVHVLRGPLARVQGVMGQTIIDAIHAIPRYFGDSNTFWRHSPFGKHFVNFVDRASRAAPDNPAGAILSMAKPGTVSAELAGQLAEWWKADGKEGVARGLETTTGKLHPEDVGAYKNKVRTIDAKLADPALDPVERGKLIIERKSAQDWLQAIQPEEAVIEAPKASIMRRIRTGQTLPGRFLSPVEHLLASFYTKGIPLGRWPTGLPRIMRVPDAVGGETHLRFRMPDTMKVYTPAPFKIFENYAVGPLWTPGQGAPPDWRSQTAEKIIGDLRLAGVRPSIARNVVDELIKAKSSPEFFDALVKNYSTALKTSKTLAPDMIDKLSRRYASAGQLVQQYSMINEVKYDAQGLPTIPDSHDLLTKTVNGQRYSVPSEESQMLSRPVPRPNMKMMLEGTSYLRTIARQLRSPYKGLLEDAGGHRLSLRPTPKTLAAVGERSLMLPFDLVHGVLDTTTAVFKPLTLVTRPFALTLRIQLDQALRGYMWGYGALAKKSPAWKAAMHDDLVREALGTILREPVERLGTTTHYVAQDLSPWLQGHELPVETAAKVHEAIYSRFQQIRSSVFDTELIRQGGPEKFTEWAQGDSARAEQWRANHDNALKTSDQTKDLYAGGTAASEFLVTDLKDGWFSLKSESGNDTLIAGPHGDGDFYVQNAGVEVPRRGTGTRMYAEAAREAARRGGKLVSGESSPDAIAFWKGLEERGAARRIPDIAEGDIGAWEASPAAQASGPAAAIRVLADLKWQELQDLSGGNEALLKGFATQRWIRPGATEADMFRAGRGDPSRYARWQDLNDQMNHLSELIAQTTEDGTRAAYQSARKAIRREQDKLAEEGRIAVSRGEGTRVVNLDNPAELRAALDDARKKGEWVPPRSIAVPTEALKVDNMTAMERFNSGTMKTLYSAMRPVSWADRVGTRGSFFEKSWRKNYSLVAARYGTGIPAFRAAEAAMAELEKVAQNASGEWLRGPEGKAWKKNLAAAEEQLKTTREAKAAQTEYIAKQAMWRAIRETNNVMYDLAARTPFAYALKNIFWFMPAYQEMLNTWLVKIPARYVPGVGHLYLANQVSALVNLLNQTGIITHGPPGPGEKQGPARIIIPHAATFLNALMQGANDIVPGTPFHMLSTSGPNKSIVSVSPWSFSLATGQQTITPIPSIVLGTFARHNGGILKTLNDMLTWHGIGADTSIGPQAISNAYTMITGRPFPLEFFSQDYQNARFNQNWHEASRMAYQILYDKGVRWPSDEHWQTEYPKAKNYGEAVLQYNDQWNVETKSLVQGWAFVSFLSSTSSPASLHLTSTLHEQVAAMYTKMTGGRPLTHGLSPQQAATLNLWRAEHPDAIPYTVGTTVEGTPFRSIPGYTIDPSVMNDLSFHDQLYTGARAALSTEQDIYDHSDPFMRKIGVTVSAVHYAALRAAVTKGLSASDIIKNYFDYSTQMNDINERQAIHETQNEQAYAEYHKWLGKFSTMSDPSKAPVQLIEAERIKTAFQVVQNIADAFTTDGLRQSDYKKMLGQLKSIYSATNPTYGAPRTDVAKGLAWYFNNVFGPFGNQVFPMYDKASQLALAVGNSDPRVEKIYTQIRQISNASGRIKGPDGQWYPSPERFMFGQLSPKEKVIRTLHWATQPLSWLTDFQRGMTGLAGAEDPKYGRMFDNITKNTAAYTAKYLAPFGKGTNEYNWYNDQLNNTIIPAYVEKKYGKEGLRLYKLSVAPPWVRLQARNFGEHDQAYQRILTWVQQASDAIKNPSTLGLGYPKDLHYSLSGDTSSVQSFYKTKLFDAITKMRSEVGPDGQPTSDAMALDRLFTNLGEAMASGGKAYLEGSSLYDALFFSNFGQSSIVPSDPSVFNRIGPGSKGTTTGTGAYADFHPLAWPTRYTNGNIPITAMIRVGNATGHYVPPDGGAYFRPDAAMSFLAMQKAAKRDGVNISVVTSYRTYQQQQEIVASGVFSAGAGQSDHGLGLAFDSNPEAFAWLQTHAHEFGWIGAYARDPIWGKGGWAGGNDPNHYSFFAGGATGGGSGSDYAVADVGPGGLDTKWILAARSYGAPATTTTSLKAPTGLDNATANMNYAKQVAAQRGWTGRQWTAIRHIVEGYQGVPGESNWLGSAHNPAGAYGIGQRYIPAHPWTSAQDQQQYTSDVATQIAWMYDYIASTYGSPWDAWLAKSKKGSY